MKMEFYRCKHCGQIIAIVKGTDVPVKCCGENMEKLIPGAIDASVEKHVPVYEVQNGKVVVTVGSIDHPMLPEHFIEWIAIETKNGNQRKILTPGAEPKACFFICGDDEVVAAYAYCNIHGLWKA